MGGPATQETGVTEKTFKRGNQPTVSWKNFYLQPESSLLLHLHVLLVIDYPIWQVLLTFMLFTANCCQHYSQMSYCCWCHPKSCNISCRVCMTMFLHVFVHPLKQKFFVVVFFQNWILIAIQKLHPISNMHALDMKVWRNVHPSRIIWQISLVSALSGAVTLAWVCFCSFLV